MPPKVFCRDTWVLHRGIFETSAEWRFFGCKGDKVDRGLRG